MSNPKDFTLRYITKVRFTYVSAPQRQGLLETNNGRSKIRPSALTCDEIYVYRNNSAQVPLREDMPAPSFYSEKNYETIRLILKGM